MNAAYHRKPVSGLLAFGEGRDERILGETDIALAWTTDEHGACLQKHGLPDLVEAQAARIRPIDPTVQVIVIPWTAIADPVAGPRILEEINACLDISGRVGGIICRLEQIHEDSRIESPAP
ncbi:hypothetical protein [Defluviimonas salinarum]|uniref:Uncharacterized protein n=1 Tax=Defluviimonas salinarum TaxID=2992147 RepID=A0ABT3J799_9RHOB|nr:hypothetical protein [Defluviimonas salinarum]MCW3783557.1 hypothetical protein [Defluviimonas salinarum]